jgi:hypothetical protein
MHIMRSLMRRSFAAVCHLSRSVGHHRLPCWIAIIVAVFSPGSAFGQTILEIPPERALSANGLVLFQGTPPNGTDSETILLDSLGLHLVWDPTGTDTWNGQQGWTYLAFGTVSPSSLSGWNVMDRDTNEWASLTNGASLHGLTWQSTLANAVTKGMKRFFIPPPRSTHDLFVVQPLPDGTASVTPLTKASLSLHVQSDQGGGTGTDQSHATAIALIDPSRSFWVVDLSEDPPLRSADNVLDLVKTNWTVTQTPWVRVSFYLDPHLAGQRFTIHHRPDGGAEQMHSMEATPVASAVETLQWNGQPLSVSENGCTIVSTVVPHLSDVWLTRNINTYASGTGDIYTSTTTAFSSDFLNWVMFGTYPEPVWQTVSIQVNQSLETPQLYIQQPGGVFPLTRAAGVSELPDYTSEGYDNTFDAGCRGK